MKKADPSPEVVAFRVDSSLEIGAGHVMRCLTLANVLRSKGSECHFLCRDLLGNLNDHIRESGHWLHPLPEPVKDRLPPGRGGKGGARSDGREPAHGGYAHWLGVEELDDAQDCTSILDRIRPEWLVVDNYALSSVWEQAVRPFVGGLMVIDDLADRAHQCDVLLDQNPGRTNQDYLALVPEGCRLLVGPRYALLREAFSREREGSLQRRKSPALQHLMISMGGMDKSNVTVDILDNLKHCGLSARCRVTVVMGRTAPWIEDVRRRAEAMPCPTEVRLEVTDMAGLMARADLAIGAAGVTALERCCLGLPALMVILAENQRSGAYALERSGAASLIGNVENVPENLPVMFDSLLELHVYRRMSAAASGLVDGKGVDRVVAEMVLMESRGLEDG